MNYKGTVHTNLVLAPEESSAEWKEWAALRPTYRRQTSTRPWGRGSGPEWAAAAVTSDQVTEVTNISLSQF